MSVRQIQILMSLLYHSDTIIKKEKELLRAFESVLQTGIYIIIPLTFPILQAFPPVH